MGKPEAEVHRRARRLLLDARDLVIRGWCLGARARDDKGRPVDPSHPSARSWSLAGALEAVSAKRVDRRAEKEEAGERGLASAALAAVIRGDPSENGALRRVDGAIRQLEAVDGRQLDAAESIAVDGRIAVRCLRCGTPYTKQATHEILEAVKGCPSCDYQGWSFAEEEPRERENAD